MTMVMLVSIPFKRESVSKAETEKKWFVSSKSFNSLQTGKRIQSVLEISVSDSTIVSIPFKRESVSKDTNTEKASANLLKSFNSLQTGKRIQSGVSFGTTSTKTEESFNSLQTGKRIQS